jgi:predicted transport protein
VVSELPGTETLSPASALAAQNALRDFLTGKPPAIAGLFAALDEYGRSLTATRRIRRPDVEYLRGETSCFTLEAQEECVRLSLSIDPEAVKAWWWSPGAKRFTIDIRQRGAREMEYSVSDAGQLDDACQLIKLAYDGAE